MSDIELFSINECATVGDGGIDDVSTAETSIARVSLVLEEIGLHYCYKTVSWRRYVQKEGVWKRISEEQFENYASAMHAHEIGLSWNDLKPLSKAKIREIKLKMSRATPLGEEWNPIKNTDYIPFENLVLDLKTKLPLKYHKELYIENKIDRKYLPDDGTECPHWDYLIDHLAQGNEKVMEVLEAFAFLAITGRETLERCILSMYSEIGGTGKGTFINALLDLAGEERGTTSDLARLNDDTIMSFLDNRTFVAFPDEREFLSTRSNNYKKLLQFTSQDVITGRIVFSSQKYAYRGNAVVIVASNVHIFPPDGGGDRRLLILKCVPPAEEDVDPDLGIKIRSEITRITNKLLQRFDFSVKKAQDIVLNANKIPTFAQNAQDNAEETSTLSAFLKDMVVAVCPAKARTMNAKEYNANYDDSPIAAVSIDSLYAGYKYFIAENNPGARPVKKTKFERDVQLYYAKLSEQHIVSEYSGNIPGLQGQKKRFVGIMFNPLTWNGMYTSWDA